MQTKFGGFLGKIDAFSEKTLRSFKSGKDGKFAIECVSSDIISKKTFPAELRVFFKEIRETLGNLLYFSHCTFLVAGQLAIFG